jgi:SAM-dependent methyltransferase
MSAILPNARKIPRQEGSIDEARRIVGCSVPPGKKVRRSAGSGGTMAQTPKTFQPSARASLVPCPLPSPSASTRSAHQRARKCGQHLPPRTSTPIPSNPATRRTSRSQRIRTTSLPKDFAPRSRKTQLGIFPGPPSILWAAPIVTSEPLARHAERSSGTEGYADEAEALVKQYASISFADVHRPVVHLIPTSPSRVLDIGAGTGRNAAGFAAMGHRVVAVEPTAELRLKAKQLHPSAPIEWLDDSLPDLAILHERGETYDVVMLTAFWMHLDARQRRRAMPRVAALVRKGGLTMLSLRHGPVPPGRRMFEVIADETIRLAQANDLQTLLKSDHRDGLFGRPAVSWRRLVFSRSEGAV